MEKHQESSKEGPAIRSAGRVSPVRGPLGISRKLSAVWLFVTSLNFRLGRLVLILCLLASRGECAEKKPSVVNGPKTRPISPPSFQDKLAKEKRIRELLESNLIVDMSDKKLFPGGEEIDGSYLRFLLLHPPAGVDRLMFKNARIVGFLNLDNTVVTVQCEFDHCVFKEGVFAFNAKWTREILFQECQIGDLQMESGIAESNLVFNKSIISGETNLSRMKIQGVMSARDCKFQKRTSQVQCERIEAEGDVSFSGAVLSGGANFSGARIRGILDFSKSRILNADSETVFYYLDVRGFVSFAQAQVAGRLSFTKADIGKDLILNGIQLYGAKAAPKQPDKENAVDADFSQIKIAGDLYMNKLYCAGGLSLQAGIVSGYVFAQEGFFSKWGGCADFSQLEVGGDLSLDGTAFNGCFDLQRAAIEGQATMRAMHLFNAEVQADFSKAKFQNLLFSNYEGTFPTVFECPVHLDNSTVSENFCANGVSFKARENNTKSLTIDGFKAIRGGVFLQEAVFWGGVSGFGLESGTSVLIDTATFYGDVDMGFMKVGEMLGLRDVRVFSKTFDFSNSSIRSNLLLSGGQFLDVEGFSNFRQSNIGGGLWLMGANFACQVGFDDSRIGGNIEGWSSSAAPLHFESGVSFDRVDVGGYLDLTNVKIDPLDAVSSGTTSSRRFFFSMWETKVRGDVRLERGQFASPSVFSHLWVEGSFSLREAKFLDDEGNTDPEQVGHVFDNLYVGRGFSMADAEFLDTCSFCDAVVKGAARVSNAAFKKEAWFDRWTVGDLFSFQNCRFEKELFLRGGSAKELVLRADSFRAGEYLTLEEFKAGIYNPGDEVDGILNLLGKSRFRPAMYNICEEAFRTRGMRDHADAVALAGMRRDREQVPLWRTERLFQEFLDLTCGMGRKPERLLGIALFFVVVGWVTFRENLFGDSGRMTAKPGALSAHRRFNALLYSVILILPFQNQFWVEEWLPRGGRRWAWWYRSVQKILGWLLCTIAIGLLLSKVKR